MKNEAFDTERARGTRMASAPIHRLTPEPVRWQDNATLWLSGACVVFVLILAVMRVLP